MTTLHERLKNFDWYYGYSDDHRVWKRGRMRMDQLNRDLKELKCPFDTADLRRAAYDQVDDLYEQFEDGGYYKPEDKAKWNNIASTQPTDMLTREKYNEIIAWLEGK